MTVKYVPTPEQKRAFESDLMVGLSPRLGGKRLAMEQSIIATAATTEDARLAIEDLRRSGLALLDGDGKRVQPPARNGARFQYVRFDEEKGR